MHSKLCAKTKCWLSGLSQALDNRTPYSFYFGASEAASFWKRGSFRSDLLHKPEKCRVRGVAVVSASLLSSWRVKFSELVRLLEEDGFRLIKQKGSVRYYAKAGHPRLIRVDFPRCKGSPNGHLPRNPESCRLETKINSMITLLYSLVIEATQDPDFFWFLLSRSGGVYRCRPLDRRLSVQG